MMGWSFSLWLLPLCLVLLTIWWYATIPANLPPGPLGLPFIGSGWWTWKAQGLHQNLHQLTKQYGPLYKLYIADKLVVVLGDWQVIQEALVKQGETFSRRPKNYVKAPQDFTPMIGIASENNWKPHRQFVLTTFRELAFRNQIVEDRILSETDCLIKMLHSLQGRPFNPSPIFRTLMANIASQFIFGRAFKHDDNVLQEALKEGNKEHEKGDVSMLAPWHLSGVAAALCRHFLKEMKPMQVGATGAVLVKSMVAETLANFDLEKDTPTNYAQAFYKERHRTGDSGIFGHEELISNGIILFGTGIEGTSETLCWGLLYLCHNPDIQESMYDEIESVLGDNPVAYSDRERLPLTKAMIMETQRLANISPTGPARQTVSDCKLRGYDIPAGTIVLPLITACHHDPQVYPNPERFDPSRFINLSDKSDPRITHLMPFLMGKRQCPGMDLAKLLLFLVFPNLVRSFKLTFSPTDDIPDPSDEHVSILGRATVPFKICAVPRDGKRWQEE